ncbi:GatB/YqeY domain-containing protein [Indiicoccus explosivorum]|uniref:GatB/YqeY domain-containing protein n=1 Tax=Indiicoccus explosivorum TaxID=1917864 RepID=UPI001390419F|nr:GatB/YqeY domain-containing protein [Indiicoccus explosivorum]
MTIKSDIDQHIKEAMKAKDKERLATLRQLKSALQNEEINSKGPLSADEEVTVVSREVKQTKEELEGYQKAEGDYAAVIDKLEKRLTELSRYLPEQMSEAEVEAAVREVITETGATGPSDKGAVLKVIMPKLKGKADGKFINETVSRLLKQ